MRLRMDPVYGLPDFEVKLGSCSEIRMRREPGRRKYNTEVLAHSRTVDQIYTDGPKLKVRRGQNESIDPHKEEAQ
jgi:hypothetical protein